jgi:hypothetical protein
MEVRRLSFQTMLLRQKIHSLGMEQEMISAIRNIHELEDTVTIKARVSELIEGMLREKRLPKTHTEFTGFIKLSFDVLAPDLRLPVELIKKAAFTPEEFDRAGLRGLIDRIARYSREEADAILMSFGEDPPQRKRRKVSWGENLVQIREIERVKMAPEADYLSSTFTRERAAAETADPTAAESYEWIVPGALDVEEMRTSEEMERQRRREANSIRICNVEEHTRFVPSEFLEEGEENETVTLPLMDMDARNFLPEFDIKRIVEESEANKLDVRSVLEDPTVIDALFKDVDAR